MTYYSVVPIPTCARCGRRVDTFSSAYDVLKQEYMFVAKCHGEVEYTSLDRVTLQSGRVERGVAFKTARLEE